MRKIIPLIAIAISLHTHFIASKTYVNPASWYSERTALQKIGCTLDECRSSIGDIIKETDDIYTAGVYVLANNIDGYITINTDDVCIDLNGYKIYDTTGTGTGITIAPHCKNIVIKNGAIKDGNYGIILSEGVQFVHIDDVNFKNCNTGIYFDGDITGTAVENCLIKDCTFMLNNKGILLNYSINNYFENCKGYNCVESVVELSDSDYNFFTHCYAVETENSSATGKAAAFYSEGGIGNTFFECVAHATKKTSSNFGCNATGFLLKGTDTLGGESGTSIINCIASQTEGTANGNAYGIHLDATIKATDPLAETNRITSDHGANLLAVSWSPKSKFIAVGGYPASTDYLRIVRFDGTTISSVATADPGAANINAVAWSPNGEFLAAVTNASVGSAEVTVYQFDQHALNSADRLTAIDTVEAGADIADVAWSPDNRFIAIAKGTTIEVWGFDGTHFSSSAIATDNPGSTVTSLQFSQDGLYLAATYADTIEIFSFDPLATSILTSKDTEIGYGGALKSVSWSPIACGNKYFIAIGGDATVDDYSLQVLTFESGTTLNSLETVAHVEDITSIKWSPNGKYILTCGSPSSGDEIEIYLFNASADEGSRLSSLDTGDLPGGIARDGDWSPNGKYVITVGDSASGDDIAIFNIANVPTNCIIKNNEVYNTTGGLAGIGLEGASSSNLMVKNTCYNNSINFNTGIYNVFTGGLNGTQNLLDNIAVPPYQN